jgi:GWxTD domain-containing protein
LNWKERTEMNRKKNLLICFYFIFFVLSIKSQEAYIGIHSFLSPESGPYAEVILHFDGNSLVGKPLDSILFSSAVEVVLLITNRDNAEIVFGDRFLLSGPVNSSFEDFYEVKRFPIINGSYLLEYQFTDFNDTSKTTSGSRNFEVHIPEEQISFSSLLYLWSANPDDDSTSRFVRNGLRMEVAPHAYFPASTNHLKVYFEIYGLLNYFELSDAYAFGFEVYKRGSNEAVVKSFRRRTVVETDVVLLNLDISDFGSGEYYFRAGVYNRAQELLAEQSRRFFRYNPEIDQILFDEQKDEPVTFENSFVQLLDGDQLVYALKAMSPVIPQHQVSRLNNILQQRIPLEMRHFIFEFWMDIDNETPAVTFDQYMDVARAIDDMFYSGFGHGFETDRGRIYLRYGRPDDMINVQAENDAPPYEIWTYNQLPGTGQTDVRFVFYNPTLAGNMYELLHSNARGETNNPRWMLELYRNNPNIYDGPNHQEAREIQPGFNRRATDFFRDN